MFETVKRYIIKALTVMPGYVSPSDTYFDPCGGRSCDECEIGGCDHGTLKPTTKKI